MKILEMKSTVTETRKLISQLGITKERICKLQDRPVQIKLKCRDKCEEMQQSLQELWDDIKWSEFLIKISEGEEKENGREEIMAKYSVKLTINTKSEVQEAQRTWGKIIPQKKQMTEKAPKHIIFKLPKTEGEEKILK